MTARVILTLEVLANSACAGSLANRNGTLNQAGLVEAILRHYFKQPRSIRVMCVGVLPDEPRIDGSMNMQWVSPPDEVVAVLHDVGVLAVGESEACPSRSNEALKGDVTVLVLGRTQVSGDAAMVSVALWAPNFAYGSECSLRYSGLTWELQECVRRWVS